MQPNTQLAFFQPEPINLNFSIFLGDLTFEPGQIASIHCSQDRYYEFEKIEMKPGSLFEFDPSCGKADRMRYLRAMKKGTTDPAILALITIEITKILVDSVNLLVV
mmetsp:Transcript_4146/g.7019  ORF Transcript_4146/g.7019 Transcript_4146/m.7019 type:complete len:106 (-) Transcript_4146:160-477(-)